MPLLPWIVEDNMDFPHIIDPAQSFDALVKWIHDDVIIAREAPGLMVGLSGTDSLVVFLAAYKAFSQAGRPDRVWGIHFAPSEDFLYDHPEAETHTWFSNKVIPWLREKCPGAKIDIDTSIDWRMDGVRWGMLGEMAAVSYEPTRHMRESHERFWVMGTRNRSEDLLYTYSNASLAAGFQPIIHLWKSELLQISSYLGIPQIAIDKSCDVDCICGRQRLPAHHIREIDLLLMVSQGELDEQYVTTYIETGLRLQLLAYIKTQILRSNYKKNIPYRPMSMTLNSDALIMAFEDGTLNLREFDHRKHLYVGWYYLRAMPFKEAASRYCYYLRKILEKVGVGAKFSVEITESYLARIHSAMMDSNSFDEMLDKHPELKTFKKG